MKTPERFTEVYFEGKKLVEKHGRPLWVVPSANDYVISHSKGGKGSLEIII